MPISSNTVFHFTSTPENLISILTHNFRPHFCLEDLSVIMPESRQQEDLMFAIPMVSFCDIPLSQASPHMKHYGQYGIGLTKKWAIKKGLAPVHYIVKNSPLALTLNTINNQLSALPQNNIVNKPVINYFRKLSTYLKPYVGISPIDKSAKPKNKRFWLNYEMSDSGKLRRWNFRSQTYSVQNKVKNGS